MIFSYIDFIGWFAAILTTSSFLPQAIKTVKTKDTKGISLLMYLIFNIGVVFWALFGFLIGNFIVVIANLFTLILSFTILIIKIKNIRNGSDK